MNKRLILHIGMHKTGSSSVQRYFSRNRAVLRRMGVCYPHSIGADGARQPKHAAIFDAISHETDYGVPHPKLGPSAGLIEQTAAEIDAAPGRFGILSAEGLSGERPDFATALAPLGKRFDVTVVVFVRRQDHWVESFYKQMVLSRDVRERRPFHDFLVAASTRSHMNYAQIIEWWRERFDDVRIIGFSPNAQTRPLVRLWNVIGLKRAYRWLPFAHAHENRSPGVEAVEVVRRRNEQGIETPREMAARIEAECGVSDPHYLTLRERRDLLMDFENGNQTLLSSMESADHSCLCPNMTELGRSREKQWRGDVSAECAAKSVHLFRATN